MKWLHVHFSIGLPIDSKLALLKSIDSADIEWSKEVKGCMYDMVVEGFQLLSRWSVRIWEQCAWKFPLPCKDFVPSESLETTPPVSDYERFNYSADEQKTLVEVVSYIKSIGSMMQRCDTVVADAFWETVHSEVLDSVQNTVAAMLRVHCLQFLINEVLTGGNMRKPGGLFGNSTSEIPANDLKQLETFFYKLSFFLHILHFSVSVATLTDLGFL